MNGNKMIPEIHLNMFYFSFKLIQKTSYINNLKPL